MTRHVAAVIATFGRPREIERLLSSLDGVDSVFVCDNSSRPEIAAIVERSPIAAHYIAPSHNLGCGGGLRAAEEAALKTLGDRLTHLLVLDDDVVLRPDTVALLADAMERENAGSAYPLVTANDGTVGWTPGLRDRRLHRLSETPHTPEEYRGLFGPEVAEFDWAQGICLLVRRDVLEKAGLHRTDFWVRGEDLDFSLRLTAAARGIFVPAAEAQHLPPESVGGSNAGEYLRHAAMVQNIALLAFTAPHGKRLRASLPGAAKRFVKKWGIRALPDLGRALRRGAKGEPAGGGTGDTFYRRFNELA